MSDEQFQSAEVNICIFPHLREFLVVDARATVPGAPHTYLLATDQVLDARFVEAVERSIGEAVRRSPRTFSELGALPQRVDDAIREQAMRAILRQIGCESLADRDRDGGSCVSVFLCVGPILSMDDAGVEKTMRAMLGEVAHDGLVAHCQAQFSRLLNEERGHAHAEEADQAQRAVVGDGEFYLTVWSRAEHEGRAA